MLILATNKCINIIVNFKFMAYKYHIQLIYNNIKIFANKISFMKSLFGTSDFIWLYFVKWLFKLKKLHKNASWKDWCLNCAHIKILLK